MGLLLSSSSAGDNAGYHVVNKLQLGGEGGWDYLTVDSAARRLYVSRGTHVIVVDIDTNKAVGDIADTPGVHGIAIAPELNRGFISNGKANTVAIFDLKTLKITATVKTGENPDAILYDTETKQVFTFNGRSKDATVFNAATGEIAATIALGGKPEFAAADGNGKIYVNIEDTNEVVEINSRKLSVTKRYSLSPCEEPTGMGFDPEHHRVFSGCHNKLMMILDTNIGKVTATVPIGEGVDGNGFDTGTGLAFSANGDGTLTIVRESSPGKFEVADTVITQRGARTMAIDTKTHNIYLPTAQFEAPDGKKQRPVPVKDTFVVLVVGK
ncbi:YncE family protein [Candidatus Magnetominusculus dajiuhuensis]|uniref:YncE family protein n=1 Tax=Candidatus Magnetominusculus dajiuhuensis TaxID=3137712 RepID=UPI003B435D5F